jgi:hypothetical protein
MTVEEENEEARGRIRTDKLSGVLPIPDKDPTQSHTSSQATTLNDRARVFINCPENVPIPYPHIRYTP